MTETTNVGTMRGKIEKSRTDLKKYRQITRGAAKTLGNKMWNTKILIRNIKG